MVRAFCEDRLVRYRSTNNVLAVSNSKAAGSRSAGKVYVAASSVLSRAPSSRGDNQKAFCRARRAASVFVAGANHTVAADFPTDWTTTPIGPASYPVGSGAPFAPKGAPIAVSPQFGATNQTDVFIADVIGVLHVFWIEADGAWNGPLALSNTNPNQALLDVPAGSFIAATAQFGATGQTDVLVFNSPTPQQEPGIGWPCVFWVNAAGSWNGPDSLGLQV